MHPWVQTLTRDAVRAAHGAGLAVNTWTCDDPARMRELIAWGVDGICTNVPDVALAVRHSVTVAGKTSRTAAGTKSNSSRFTSPR